jgi:hypothetical protein
LDLPPFEEEVAFIGAFAQAPLKQVCWQMVTLAECSETLKTMGGEEYHRLQ